MLRYGIISEKDPREIVLLRGTGCFYRKCTFCDYHLDACSDDDENYELNKSVLKQVTGVYGNLEVINSGSFHELGERTLLLIRETAREKVSKPTRILTSIPEKNERSPAILSLTR